MRLETNEPMPGKIMTAYFGVVALLGVAETIHEASTKGWDMATGMGTIAAVAGTAAVVLSLRDMRKRKHLEQPQRPYDWQREGDYLPGLHLVRDEERPGAG